MNPILDHILTEIILWRLQYLESVDTADEDIEDLKFEYLRLARRVVKKDEYKPASEEEFAEYLSVIFSKAKERAKQDSLPIHTELDHIEREKH